MPDSPALHPTLVAMAQAQYGPLWENSPGIRANLLDGAQKVLDAALSEGQVVLKSELVPKSILRMRAAVDGVCSICGQETQ